MRNETQALINLVNPPIGPRITDDLFLGIESDPQAAAIYNSLLTSHSTAAVNAYIGKFVKDHYGLTNSGAGLDPQSKLIKTFTLH